MSPQYTIGKDFNIAKAVSPQDKAGLWAEDYQKEFLK